MRFFYEPTTGEVTAYVKREEFDLAANETEYRVFKRVFDVKNLENFLKLYSKFIKDIFEYLAPDEQIQDLIAVSNGKQGYTWRSVIDMAYGEERPLFLENLITYGLHAMDRECVKLSEGQKNIVSMISKKDETKLSMIMSLLDMSSLPEPFQKNKKFKKPYKGLRRKIDSLNKKLKAYEDKYGFSSEQALLYYKDDMMPEDSMVEWLKLIEEKKYLSKFEAREALVDEFIKKWQETM